jgi:hypothetical protein
VPGEEGRAEEDLACARYIARAVTEPGVDAAEYVRRAAGRASGRPETGRQWCGER